jgi:hypothetical protein
VTTPPVNPAEIAYRDIILALHGLYPHSSLSASLEEDGTLLVRMPPRTARYWGVERDPQYAAAQVTRNLSRPVEIRSVSFDRQLDGDTAALVTFALAGQPAPAGPRSPDDMPLYATVDEVIGGFPATRLVRVMIQAAIDGGLRPCIDPSPSPRGPRYMVELCGVDTALGGFIEVSEVKGQFAGAVLLWVNGWEIPYGRDQADLVRKEITGARDLHRAQMALRGRRTGGTAAGTTSLKSADATVTTGTRSTARNRAASRRRAAQAARAAQWASRRGLRW